MKNIHILPTDKPTGIFKSGDNLLFSIMNKVRTTHEGFHIYITSDEEIKFDEYYLGDDDNIYCLVSSVNRNGKKIILTTDQDLIKDGVQTIDDEFLEWFVKNPSCEEVEIRKKMYMPQSNGKISDGKITHEISLDPSQNTLPYYKIIIPKEEPKKIKCYCGHTITCDCSPLEKPKQETLEEARKRISKDFTNVSFKDGVYHGVLEGAKWQQERMYSEEDLKSFATHFHVRRSLEILETIDQSLNEWFEQLKKK